MAVDKNTATEIDIAWSHAEEAIKSGEKERGLALLKKLSDKGVWQASTYIGRLLEEGESFKDQSVYIEAAHWFSRALSQCENADTHLDMGRYYYFGLAGKHDFDRAFRHLSQTDPDQNATAALMLGELYFCGLGTQKDWDKAKQLFASAARMEYPAAMVGTARILRAERRFFKAYATLIKAIQLTARIAWKDKHDDRLRGIGGKRGTYRRDAFA